MSDQKKSSSMTGNNSDSLRQNSNLPNNGIKFAGEESKDKMYEPKHTKKLIRVLTVVAYVFSVSLAAIMLSIYYVFLWNPRDQHHVAVHGVRNSSGPQAAVAAPAACLPARDTAGSLQPAYQHLPLSSYNLSQSVSPTMETPVDGTPRS
ncbi:putative transmembrane protein INAFM2 isoform X1 [Anabrus simplex]|uniref:putative transmembrane protein INAFM2 isoform X1 n=1 Tax=Anabrus simplex TaxID=316456 RepID=UPI0034DDB071